jgi:hypothetical protein
LEVNFGFLAISDDLQVCRANNLKDAACRAFKLQSHIISRAAHEQSAVGAIEVSPVRSRGAAIFEEKPR